MKSSKPKDGDLLIARMKAQAYFLSVGFPEWEPSEKELIMWLWMSRN